MSKGLKALEVFKDLNRDYETWECYTEEIDIIEKELKALEIIKENRVDVYALVIAYDLNDYNEMVRNVYKITQEEYEFLKEVLGDDR